jgi:diaminohydroxyphosphoribosylaminopyrimidine deaminase/5-amino-6-(5-phosphoribosylamino)uracil reductase
MPRPTVTLKLATSLDGRIATASGESQWITGEAARAEVQKLRAAHGAVMIGAGTARADNPSLLARTEPPPAKQPMRVVVTNRLKLTPEGKLFEGLEHSPLLIFGAEHARSAYYAVLEGAGAQIEIVPKAGDGADVGAVLERLGERGVRSVVVECGGVLAAALIGAGAVDRVEWFRAPMLLGGEGRPGVAALALGHLADAPRFKRVAVCELGPDLWESYERAARKRD